MNSTKPYTAVPFAILRKLRLVRQRKLWVQVAGALVAAMAVLLAAMGVAMLIDWLATLYDSRWRVVLTLAALTAAGLTIAGWLFVAFRKLLGLERIAGDVDRQFPQLAERWTTMTRLSADANNPAVVHPAMLRRVAAEAASWEPHVEPEQIVSLSIVTRAMIGLTAITAMLAVAVLFDSRQTLVLMRRFWLPASSISATELVNVPGNVVVGRGEPLALAAAVKGKPVDRATLFLRSEADESKTITLISRSQDPIEFAHRVGSVEQPFAYRFRAGDGQTEWYTVGVADRPEIAELRMTITPPAYTGRPAKTFDRLPQRVLALEKSELEFALRPKSAVESVELRFGADKSVRLSADADGWFHWHKTLAEGFTLSPVLTESHGLTNRRIPKCQFAVYRDKPPAVKVLTPDDQMAVRPDDTVQITFTASDDVGIGTAELLVYDEAAAATAGGEPVPIAAIPIPLGDQRGARSIQHSVDLDLNQFMAEDGAQISYEIRVRESRGGGSQLPTIAMNDPIARVAANSRSGAPPGPADPGDQGAASQAAGSSAASSPGDDQSSSNPRNQTSPGDSAASSAARSANNQSGSSPANIQSSADSEQSPTAINPSASQAASTQRNDGQQPPDGTATSNGPRDNTGQTVASDRAGSQPDGAKPQAAASRPGRSIFEANAPESDGTNAANAKPGERRLQPGDTARPGTTASSQSSNDMRGAKPNGQDASKLASNQSAGSADSSSDKSNKNDATASNNDKAADDNPSPRTATTGRQSLAADRKNNAAQQPDSMPEANEQPKSAEDATSQTAQDASQKPGASQQASDSARSPNETAQQSASQSASADNRQNQPRPQQTSSGGARRPGDSMPKRSLDVAQASSSQRMRLNVDQWAGSYEGQQRAKLEMAISPELAALDKALEKAQRTARGVLDELEANKKWRPTHDREVTGAERSTVEAQTLIDKLQQRTKDTPYAFIGLQVADIGLAHVGPARSNFWKALESEGDDRVTSVHDAWQHLVRARELLKDLQSQYERTRREFRLAESMEKVKKMYQVYLENSQALLEMQERDPTRYGRTMVEFDLDEEYLARLKEVLEMRRELRAELARLLAEDPRLLRRFMDSLRYRSNNLREELARLVADQGDLNREVRAWSLVSEADRPRIAKILMLRQVQDAAKMATAAGELQSRYQTWLPLDRESKDPELASASRTIQEMATAASELGDTAQRFVAEAQRVTAKNLPAASGAASAPDSSSTQPADAQPAEAQTAAALDGMLADAQALYNQLNKLEVALRQIATREEGETALFAANRLVDARRLVADTSAWVRQLRAHKEGNYPGAAEVDQYRLAMKTDELAGKLGSIEQTLAGLMQREDGTLPEPIAEKAREFITTLDREVSPNQLAAVYALHSKQLPRANARQKSAGDALVKAEKMYDDLIRMAIDELDKLPVQDPIADLLDDPTLDELLAELEQEFPVQELLGIPQRPSNLQIIGDWMRPGGDNAIASGGGAGQMLMNQMRQDQLRTQQQLNQAYQQAIARALKETTQVQNVEIPKPTKLSDWNRLVSKLGDDLRQGRDKAPPEEYRRAIEQYFSQISRAVAENEAETP